jgi:chromosome segregation ATPase
MQSKSTRGVQQDEVWTAADALIAEGLRPTIERVRLKIGRGSPNTVSPMLEAWFATLAPRLGVAATGNLPADEGVPKALRQGLDAVWATAIAAAHDKANAALTPERDRLAQLGRELESAGQHLLQREAALNERGAALQQALELAKSQLKTQATQLEKTGRELEQARSSLATLIKERDSDRCQFDKRLHAISEERQRNEQQVLANERRLLGEVDRARQEAKQSARAQGEANQSLLNQLQVLEHKNSLLSHRVHDGQIEFATLKERLHAAEERVRGLEHAIKNRFATPKAKTRSTPSAKRTDQAPQKS